MAELITWSDEYLIGVGEFDIQHKELTILVNDVLLGSQQMLQASELLQRMELMIKYAKWHFRCEEGLMRIYQYSEMAAHLEEHRMLVANIEEKRTQMADRVVPAPQLYQFFVAWFGGHAFGADVEMAKFINKVRGRSNPVNPIVS